MLISPTDYHVVSNHIAINILIRKISKCSLTIFPVKTKGAVQKDIHLYQQGGMHWNMENAFQK